MNHTVGRAIFGLVVGLGAAWISYTWLTNPAGRTERAIQEAVVLESRIVVSDTTGIDGLEFVDALAANRQVGKAYVYREENGWSVSGYYRRDEDDRWHPWLLALSAERQLISLKIQDKDAGLVERASANPLLEISP
ncbi:MAG: hypothetical protein K0U72_00810 [Gammaproteobacteria bacterium]|nr:hypothetical protein [Gammaproteobacteria bacterium]